MLTEARTVVTREEVTAAVASVPTAGALVGALL